MAATNGRNNRMKRYELKSITAFGKSGFYSMAIARYGNRVIGLRSIIKVAGAGPKKSQA